MTYAIRIPRLCTNDKNGIYGPGDIDTIGFFLHFLSFYFLYALSFSFEKYLGIQ